MITQGPPAFIVPLIYSDFFGSRPTRDELTATVRRMNWQLVVKLAAGIAGIKWMQGVENKKLQSDLVKALTEGLLYGPAIALKLRDEPHRRLFTRESLLAVLRLAVVDSSAGEDRPDFPELFTRSILMVNELLADELNPVVPSGSSTDLLASELRSVALQMPNPHELLGRTCAFFEWSAGAVGVASANRLDVKTDLHRFTGLSLLENTAGAYAVLSRFANLNSWDDVEKQGVAFDLDHWLAEFGDQRVLRQWFSARTTPISEAKADWANEPSLSAVGARTLWQRPVVLDDDKLCFVPSPVVVADWMGDGAYYALMDGYREAAGSEPRKRREAVERFTRFYGEFFEDYVVGLLKSGYAGRSDAHVSPEVEYKPDILSSDAVVSEADDILFFEVVAKRMSFVESVIRLDEKAIGRDLEAGVIKKARQLHRNVEDYRAGVLFPDQSRPKGQRIFPIIVAPNEWPRITVIDSVLPRLAHEEGLLANAEPLELLDIGEVEWLETALQSGLRLGALLDRKNNLRPQHRHLSLHNYMYYGEPGTVPGATAKVRDRGAEVATSIIELVKTWHAKSA